MSFAGNKDTGWEEVELAASRMFNVWAFGSELKFAEEAWGHFHAAGLVGGTVSSQLSQESCAL